MIVGQPYVKVSFRTNDGIVCTSCDSLSRWKWKWPLELSKVKESMKLRGIGFSSANMWWDGGMCVQGEAIDSSVDCRAKLKERKRKYRITCLEFHLAQCLGLQPVRN